MLEAPGFPVLYTQQTYETHGAIFTSSAHCKGAVKTAGHVLLMIRSYFSELSIVALTPLFPAGVRGESELPESGSRH